MASDGTMKSIVYGDFLLGKSHTEREGGLSLVESPPMLYPFQRALVEWSLGRGRSAIFADCGLGKTPIQLTWASEVSRQTSGRVLVLTPLAVGPQTVEESEKFNIDGVARSTDGTGNSPIAVTNYERLHYFDPSDFVGVVCDESSILKNFDGARRQAITDFMKHVPYRLLATATAAPNDYIELGTSSESLGEMGHMDMLGRFFKNDLNNSATGRQWGSVTKWRFKGHAEHPFWRWVCSWARAIRKPSDLGYDDEDFLLPPLQEVEHTVEARTLPDGMLFALPAMGLREQREERRRTIHERCELAADLVRDSGEPAMVWCHLNDEGDLLERLIPDAVQVSGKDDDETKERRLLGFAHGDHRVLITKPKIGAWGLNFQHCAHVVTFPSHSFEQYYQSVRRCWRFGQRREVRVDVVTTEGEKGVLANLQRKATQADAMFANLVMAMRDELNITTTRTYPHNLEVPSWLCPIR